MVLDGVRYPRASAGAFSGVSNGQFYGGTYQAPENGPPIVNRFGNPPANGFPSPIPNSYGGSYAPQFPFGPFIPPFQNSNDFNGFFREYFKTFNDNLAARRISNTPHSSSSSGVSLSFGNTPIENDSTFTKNFEFQRAAFEAAQNAFQKTSSDRFGGSGYGPNLQYGPNFAGGAAASSASFGPGGGHLSAGTYPENAANPNVHTRFSSTGPGKGGTYGVSSTSFSTSSNIGGKKTGYKEASTTVNDNGKVTTYTVKN
ncbi:uncharacterized protein LOC143911791 isoform X2 [Arctopsyche grandis]|uniref:uncharacterized protein LOC143911791 isoform X2 n=1 Tax=Arctopsyche grandis TaxID=121162 RepID=UPI00406D639F